MMARKSNRKWADVVGFEGLYQVSTEGDVKTLPRMVPCGYNGHRSVPEKILRPRTNGSGYRHAQIYEEGIPHVQLVHRMVAEAYIPNPDNLRYVRHIDGNILNNDVSNLYWATDYTSPKTYTVTNATTGEGKTIYNMSKFCAENGLELSTMYRVASGEISAHRGWARIKSK